MTCIPFSWPSGAALAGDLLQLALLAHRFRQAHIVGQFKHKIADRDAMFLFDLTGACKAVLHHVVKPGRGEKGRIVAVLAGLATAPAGGKIGGTDNRADD
ncbi:MAG TPA: hypothetical protein VGA77_05170 [Propylenella sp.]